jgi:hypothetical protein
VPTPAVGLHGRGHRPDAVGVTDAPKNDANHADLNHGGTGSLMQLPKGASGGRPALPKAGSALITKPPIAKLRSLATFLRLAIVNCLRLPSACHRPSECEDRHLLPKRIDAGCRCDGFATVGGDSHLANDAIERANHRQSQARCARPFCPWSWRPAGLDIARARTACGAAPSHSLALRLPAHGLPHLSQQPNCRVSCPLESARSWS